MTDTEPAAAPLTGLYAAVAAVLDGDAADPAIVPFLHAALEEVPLSSLVAAAVIAAGEELDRACRPRDLDAAAIAAAVAHDRSHRDGPGPHSALLLLAERYLSGGLTVVGLGIPALCEAHEPDPVRNACVDLLACVVTWGAKTHGEDPLARARALCLAAAR